MFRKTIREIISDMMEIGGGTHCLYFHESNKAVNLMYGRPDDIYGEYSYSRWKNINGKPVCRWIHCRIPKELQKPEIEKYRIDPLCKDWAFGEYIIPEREFNAWMSWFRFDSARTLYFPYEIMLDVMEFAEL